MSLCTVTCHLPNPLSSPLAADSTLLASIRWCVHLSKTKGGRHTVVYIIHNIREGHCNDTHSPGIDSRALRRHTLDGLLHSSSGRSVGSIVWQRLAYWLLYFSVRSIKRRKTPVKRPVFMYDCRTVGSKMGHGSTGAFR